MSAPRFYITTAIDYPNAAPHMGHAYEKLVSDCYARWYRWLGYEVHYLTGTDENGQKLKKAADEAGKDPQMFVDEQAEKFRELCKILNISNDDFIRTTEDRHRRVAQELWTKLESSGDIYQGDYEGQYCLSCEAFYTELQAPDRVCPVHQGPLESVKEKGYFFRLSQYAAQVEALIAQGPDFVRPESAKREILQRLRSEPVRDLSVSRPNSGWGITLPGNEDYVMYTWFDALINYYSAVVGSENEKYWPADVHVIGKDITWFHCVIWPAVLLAAKLPLAKQVYVHGMVLGQDGRKMSKSLGNGVDPLEVLKSCPVDSFRYYILRAIPSGMDGAFIVADLQARHNNELANDLGNLVMRVLKLSLKKLGETLPPAGSASPFNFKALQEKMTAAMEKRDHTLALETLWAQVQAVNLYINEKAPWKHKEDTPELREVLYAACFGIFGIACLLRAFLPEVSKRILQDLGVEDSGPEGIQFGAMEFRLQMPEPLFPKFELETVSEE